MPSLLQVIYAAAIRSCFLKRECSFALEVLQMMVDAELPISAATLTSLISACGRARNYVSYGSIFYTVVNF
jgi:hypothetical protein